MDDCAIALGYGSLYNHAYGANANFVLDIEHKTIDIIAVNAIEPSEEITINYHGDPWDKSPLWFDMV
jgi:SET domain-containing protein